MTTETNNSFWITRTLPDFFFYFFFTDFLIVGTLGSALAIDSAVISMLKFTPAIVEEQPGKIQKSVATSILATWKS